MAQKYSRVDFSLPPSHSLPAVQGCSVYTATLHISHIDCVMFAEAVQAPKTLPSQSVPDPLVEGNQQQIVCGSNVLATCNSTSCNLDCKN